MGRTSSYTIKTLEQDSVIPMVIKIRDVYMGCVMCPVKHDRHSDRHYTTSCGLKKPSFKMILKIEGKKSLLYDEDAPYPSIS